ncbi:hypothetical protein GCM10009131_06660 [Morganella psychrotolerans]
MLTLKTTFGGFFEALRCTTYSFNLWHFNIHFALLKNELAWRISTGVAPGAYYLLLPDYFFLGASTMII